jgi:hypothetical protein
LENGIPVTETAWIQDAEIIGEDMSQNYLLEIFNNCNKKLFFSVFYPNKSPSNLLLFTSRPSTRCAGLFCWGCTEKQLPSVSFLVLNQVTSSSSLRTNVGASELEGGNGFFTTLTGLGPSSV